MNNMDNKTQLFLGNNIELLRQLPDNSVDAIVTDPPYGLGEEPNPTEVLQSWITTGYHEIEGKGFMGKEWDAFVPQPIFWKEAYRVLKHGGHVLSFFGTRTYDWGVMAMRFAGFQVKDCIQWLHGVGFPKSHNIVNVLKNDLQCKIEKKNVMDALNSSFQPKKMKGMDGQNIVVGNVLAKVSEKGTIELVKIVKSNSTFQEAILTENQGKNKEHFVLLNANLNGNKRTLILKIILIGKVEDLLEPMDTLELMWEKENIDLNTLSLWNNISEEELKKEKMFTILTEIEPTIELKICNYFLNPNIQKFIVNNHSALKPANEPIVLARKPLEKGLSIAENVLKHSTGGLNIDGCRVGNDLIKGQKAGQGFNNVKGFGVNTKLSDEEAKEYISQDVNGRFPANLILTHHPECECVGTKKVGSGKEGGYNYKGNVYEVEGFIGNNSPNANSNYGQETIENWICHPDCPVKLLDEQSGVLNKQGVSKSDNKSGWQNQYVGGNDVNPIERTLYLDTGGASRFFMNFDSGGNDSFFYYIYEEINTKICGNILENQKVVGMLNGVMLEAEKYIQSVEQFMFGNKSMENYQMDAKYTISTLTKQMIELKTCNALQGLNIDFYTEELLKTINSLTILSIEDVNFANCINRFKNLLLELVEHIKGIVNHVKSPYYKNGEKTIEKNTTHTIENMGKDQKHRFFYTAKASKDDRNEGLNNERWFYNLELVSECCSFTEENLFIWEQEELNQNTDLNGEAQQKKDISGVIAQLAKDSECYITLNGKNITAVFPTAIKFTTKTGLKQTIELKTLNFYQPLSINDCIVDVLEMNKANGSNLAENVGVKNLLKLIFTKDEMGFPLGVRIAAKKTPLSINVKEKWPKTNIHSTVKPTELMRYLCRLITPPNGIVLDPFMGSGSTGKAAILEGFKFIGMELEEEYYKIAEARIAKAERDYLDSIAQLKLF